MSDLLRIEYEGGQDQLLAAPGLFSFTLYDHSGKLDGEVGWVTKSNEYIVGVLSYLRIVRTAPWVGWRVVIHITPTTLEKNPRILSYLQDQGAILGICTLAEEYAEYEGFIRASRYFPMFFFDRTVAIRDADTIFDQYIAGIIPHSSMKDADSKIAALDSRPFHEFAERLSHWEQVYAERTRGFSNAVVFSYDMNYMLPGAGLNKNKTNKVYLGTAKSYKGYRNNYFPAPRARLLAGMLTKYGPALPMELWASELLGYIPKFIEERAKYETPNYHLMDEYYLTDVIYKWCKANGRVEFFKANYVSPSYEAFAAAHFGERSPESNTMNWEKHERSVLEAKKAFPLRSYRDSVHAFALFNPESYHLRPEVFNSPLRYGMPIPNILANKPNERAPHPDWMPNYVFGGGAHSAMLRSTRSTRRRKATKKTRKQR